MAEDNTYFNIDARLLFQLGEKLVTNRAVALAELIKNSYDADATYVTVKMENIKYPGGTIIVEDNGTGMTFSTFKDTWMRIATIDKELNPISTKYHRQKAGEKGIGRFACRKLAKRLLLKSIAETHNGNKEELTATFEWSSFMPGTDLDKTPIKYLVRPAHNDVLTGTVLTLEDTTEDWDVSDIRRLRIELLDLIAPTTIEPESEFKSTPETYDPGFKMELDCAEFETAYEKLDSAFFKNAWARLTGSVDKQGKATYRVEVINKVINKIDKNFQRAETFKCLNNTKLDIYIFSYRADLFGHSEWSFNRTQRIGEERGGLKVYADNFRVFGYGAKGDDWLRVDYDRARSHASVDSEIKYLATDRRPGLRLFRNQNLFGHVQYIRKDNPNLDITVNRERLTEGEAFSELAKFTRLGIDFATVIYSNEIAKEIQADLERRRKLAEKQQKELEEAIKKAEEAQRKAEEERRENELRIDKLLKDYNEATSNRISSEKQRRVMEEERRSAEENARILNNEEAWQNVATLLVKEKELIEAERIASDNEEKLKRAYWEAIGVDEGERKSADIESKKAEEDRRRIEELEKSRQKERYAQELAQLRVLASTGTLILIFEHELQALIDDMEEMINNASFMFERIPNAEKTNYTNTIETFSERTEMIKELGVLLGITIGKESRLEKKEWVLYPLIESVFKPFYLHLKDFGVTYKNTMPDNLRTPEMHRSELVSVLHNLMTNAFKAVKGQQDRNIEVTGYESDGIVHIQFLDSGRGVDRSRWETVFEPFESDSEPDIRFGAGTGLGLKIARDIIRAYSGDITFIAPPNGWKTCVEITLPLEV